MAVFGVIGIATLLISHAATPDFAWQTAGAHFPISYKLSSLTGTVRYVATNGSDSTGNGSKDKPYATVAKAYGASASGGSIVIRDGTYRQGYITIAAAKPVRIIAYPGETPIFNGSAPASSGWASEGSLKYHSYTPMPVTDGSGVNFTSGQNLAGDGVGKYPDEAWAGGSQLQQVLSKAAVTTGKFYVDRGANRLYMTSGDAAKSEVELANIRTFITIKAPGTILEGIKITRYANAPSDYGVVNILGTADNTVVRNVTISDSAFMAMLISGNDNINTGTTLKHVSIGYSNWMGVSANYTDNLTFDQVFIHGLNRWGEFTYSPQSGAIKTSRSRYVRVLNSQIRNNVSHGLWFDQSNYDVQVAGNVLTENHGTAVFFEISDKLTMVNNYIRTLNGDRSVKLAGSSQLRLVNNTIFGGTDPVGIYVDSRSKPGCANPGAALCAGSYGSDRDSKRAYISTMTWMPRLDMMVNNVISDPTGNGYCGTKTTLCITQTNGGANVPINAIIHQADATGPRTIINGNVYANGSGTIIHASSYGNFSTVGAFSAAMAGGPVGIGGFEAAGRSGSSYVGIHDGNPSNALIAIYNQAAPVPTDPIVNRYIPAGTKHYGSLFK